MAKNDQSIRPSDRRPADHFMTVRAPIMATKHVRVAPVHDYDRDPFVIDAVAIEAANVVKAVESLVSLGYDSERTSVTSGPFSAGLASGIAKRLWRELQLPTFVWGGPFIVVPDGDDDSNVVSPDEHRRARAEDGARSDEVRVTA